ncbi:MAG: hypothetical protein M3R30_04495 [Candidatus Eremiobacteraeota bacterium]|nr:hypothetical protein [Candidatus Eremiobacteraeota bacterium]
MTTRKDFLIATTAVAALAPAVASAAPATPAGAAKNGDIPKFAFDRAGFDAITARVAQHRHSFASTKLEDGDVLNAMTNVMNAYEEALDEKPVSITAAAVLYHGSALALGFNDWVWNEMFVSALPKMPPSVKADIATLKKGDGNAWLHKPKTGDHDSSIETLVMRGGYFFMCNNATKGFAHVLAGALGITPAAAYTKLTTNLVPHAFLVPAGVWAIHALQEAQFTYQQATL